MEDHFIELEHIVKKLGKDTITYMPAKLIPGIINILSVAIFTRIFNPNDYGQYIMVFTTATILIFVLSQWITQSILRYRSQYVLCARTSIFNRNVLVILTMLTVFTCLFATAIYPLSGFLGNYRQFYLVAVLVIIAGLWFYNLLAISQADLKATRFSLYTIINAVTKLALALFIIFYIAKDTAAILWGIFFGFAIVSIAATILLISSSNSKSDLYISGEVNEKVTRNLPESFRHFFRQFFIYGFPMIGWFMGSQLLSISDRYLLQIFRNSEEVGVYSSNYNLVASAILFVSMPLLTAAHPLLMKTGTFVSSKKKAVQQIITVFSRYFLILTFPIMAYVTVLSEDLATVFLGPEFRQGSIILPIVLCGLLAWYFAMFGHKGLEFREKTNIMFMYVMICTIIKLILNVLFIPRYGYIAAAITTLICFLIYPILVYFGSKSDIKWNIPWLSLVKIFIASTVLAALFVTIRLFSLKAIVNLGICAIVMIPVYIIILYLLQEIKPYEINFLKGLLRKHRVA